MFSVGHVALSYLIGKALSRYTEQDLNVPVIWALSILPDIDLLISGLRHRGPTHSLIVALLVFAPVFIIMSKRTIPYFAAFVTHALIGDYITNGGVELLWPLSSEPLEFRSVTRMGSAFETGLELALFAMLIITLILSRDYKNLFNTDKKNIFLLIPLCTIFIPITFRYPIKIPKILVIPNLILMSIMALSALMSLTNTLKESLQIKNRI